jgi:hypothetical protein
VYRKLALESCADNVLHLLHVGPVPLLVACCVLHTCVLLSLLVHPSSSTHICIYAYIYISHIQTHTHTHTYMYTYMYIYIYTHTHIIYTYIHTYITRDMGLPLVDEGGEVLADTEHIEAELNGQTCVER